MGQAYVVTSGKGGVGKTVSVFNLGVGLSLSGKSVIILDADVNLPKLDIMSGLEGEIEELDEFYSRFNNFSDLKNTHHNIDNIIIRYSSFSDFCFMPAQALENIGLRFPGQMKGLIWYLKETFDYVLIDCPSGIDNSFNNAICSADKGIVITTPDMTSVRNADTVIGKLEDLGLKDNMLIINRLNTKLMRNLESLSVDDIVDILSIDLLGIVPEDDNVISSLHRGTPLITKEGCAAGRAYRDIVSRLLGEQREFLYHEVKETFVEKAISRLSNLIINRLPQGRKVNI